MRYYVFFAFLCMDLNFFHRILSIDSTTGNEAELVDMLAVELAAPGREIEVFPTHTGNKNLLVSWGAPRLVFCTHLDTVPPYIPPTFYPDRVEGRGTCDAKGQIFSMYEACKELEARGYRNFGLLLLSEEETGSYGAKSFNAMVSCEGGREYDWVVVGEPTDNYPASAAKGTKSFEVTFTGQACHSGYPQYGQSAIMYFNDFVTALRSIVFPSDPVLGETTWNIGKLSSDNPQNILSDSLTCRVYFRTTFESDTMVCNIMKNIAGDDAKLRFGRPSVQDGSDIVAKGVAAWQKAMSVKEFGGDYPINFSKPTGFCDAKPVAFGSDAPHLDCFKHKMLCGPGSILVAHKPEEYILIKDIEKAVQNYIQIAESLLKE